MYTKNNLFLKYISCISLDINYNNINIIIQFRGSKFWGARPAKLNILKYIEDTTMYNKVQQGTSFRTPFVCQSNLSVLSVQ